MQPALLKNPFALITHSGDIHYEIKMSNTYSTDMKTVNHFVLIIYQNEWAATNYKRASPVRSIA